MTHLTFNYSMKIITTRNPKREQLLSLIETEKQKFLNLLIVTVMYYCSREIY